MGSSDGATAVADASDPALSGEPEAGNSAASRSPTPAPIPVRVSRVAVID
jgi:hypothetical protein